RHNDLVTCIPVDHAGSKPYAKRCIAHESNIATATAKQRGGQFSYVIGMGSPAWPVGTTFDHQASEEVFHCFISRSTERATYRCREIRPLAFDWKQLPQHFSAQTGFRFHLTHGNHPFVSPHIPSFPCRFIFNSVRPGKAFRPTCLLPGTSDDGQRAYPS